MRLSQIFTTT